MDKLSIDELYKLGLERELAEKRATLESYGLRSGYANDAAYYRAKEIEEKLENYRIKGTFND